MALFISNKGPISGREGGQVYAHNRFGQYIRRHVVPTNPNSPQQQAIRSSMQVLANYWQNSLDDTERESWADYAANVPMLNRMGSVIHLTAINMFVRSNTPRLIVGLAIKKDAPAVYNLGSLSLPTVGAVVIGPPSTVSITPVVTDDWYLDADGRGWVYFSRPNDTTVNFFKGPYRRSLTNLVGLGGATVMTLPFPVVAGQRVFAQMRGMCKDGRLSAPVQFQFPSS